LTSSTLYARVTKESNKKEKKEKKEKKGYNMATNARKKLNKMTPSEAITEMIEWEDKGEIEHPRYRQLKKLYPQIETNNYRKVKAA